ncbi:unnamed protein product [Trichogramma brassicae]|uniref:Uncharacterized protein n=1 Tax=Trichogramma brassicae TaxID=86971 RepID=A0A6H5IVL2_9HYME|nr:unnamed protein product [Trichogramma brassicae]
MGFLSGQFFFVLFQGSEYHDGWKTVIKDEPWSPERKQQQQPQQPHPHPTSSSSRISAKTRTNLALLPSPKIVPSRHQISGSSSSSSSSQGKKAAQISPSDHCRLTRRRTPARSHSSISRRRRSSRHPKTASRGD